MNIIIQTNLLQLRPTFLAVAASVHVRFVYDSFKNIKNGKRFETKKHFKRFPQAFMWRRLWSSRDTFGITGAFLDLDSQLNSIMFLSDTTHLEI